MAFCDHEFSHNSFQKLILSPLKNTCFLGLGCVRRWVFFSQLRCLVMMTSLGEWAKSVPPKNGNKKHAPHRTNIEPEHWHLEDEIPFWGFQHFQVSAVNFWGGYLFPKAPPYRYLPEIPGCIDQIDQLKIRRHEIPNCCLHRWIHN